MTPKRSILIISTAVDLATDDVIRILRNRGADVIRINSEDLPFGGTISIDYKASSGSTLSINGRRIHPQTIWYRRLRTPPKPKEMDSGIYDFCLRENRSVLLGGLMTQSVRWMSHPKSVWQAEFKPYQLRAAQEAGLKIPKTMISNDPSAILRARAEFGDMIIKPARSGYFQQEGDDYAVFTSEFTEEHLEYLDDARWTPSIYQELVPKMFDVRATYIGGRIFAAAIHSQTDRAASIDWRKTEDANLPHSRIELPSPVLGKLRILMTSLGLEFGCIDLVKTPSGGYVFLEVNPSGQWLWLDELLDLGISHGVADWLVAA